LVLNVSDSAVSNQGALTNNSGHFKLPKIGDVMLFIIPHKIGFVCVGLGYDCMSSSDRPENPTRNKGL
jgi:hypothetical protein